MNRIIVVDCNLKVGGIQKALVNYLKSIGKDNDVTLLLFYKHGPLLSEIPPFVNIEEIDSDLKYMGMAQSDCKSIIDKCKRAFYVLVSKLINQDMAFRIASRNLKSVGDYYDEAISYSHVTNEHTFYGGTPQYVLQLRNVKKKKCFVHCDYLTSGNRSEYSDRIYEGFDEIICVSKSTRDLFLKALPQMSGKVNVEFNQVDEARIKELSALDAFQYDKNYLNMISVARLTKEKGISRFVSVLGRIKSDRYKYYIIGDGSEREIIKKLIHEYQLTNQVILLGVQQNPYRFMKNADLLIVPSYHEAAPVVFQEAIVLGLPVFTTRTSSADEMIGNRYGMVVDNSDQALEEGILSILQNQNMTR